MYAQLAKDVNVEHAALAGKNNLQMLYEFLLSAQKWAYFGSSLFRVDVCHEKVSY